jgi:hypothetical protein
MKSLGLIVVLIFSLQVFGQLENFIVNEEGLWSTVEIHCFPNGNNYNTYYIKYTGDTIINSYSYKKIWRCDEENLTNWTFYGFIREDDEHRVFLKPPDYIEGLIYDFGVNPGDTVQALNVYLNSNDSLNFVVTQVDSVLLLDRYRKRITLYEFINQKEEVWVEGLGSYYGILNSCNNSYGGACGGYDGLCFLEDELLVYQNPQYGTCYYSVTVGVRNIKTVEYKVIPNPAKDFVTLAFPDDKARWIEITDISGKKVLKNLLFEKNILLNLQEVDNGIYILRVFDENNYYPPYKLIVD